MDYIYDDVTMNWEYRPGCDSSAGVANLVFLDYSEFITIADSSVTISSDSDVVGENTNGLTVEVTDVTFPDEGRIIVTVPKRIGTTSMISANSCGSFASTGLTTATCDDISFETAGDEITVTFTTGEGEIDVTLEFTDFDNPFTTTAWPGFGYEV